MILEGYKTCLSNQCGIGTFTNVLRYIGEDIYEFDVLNMGGGLSTVYYNNFGYQMDLNFIFGPNSELERIVSEQKMFIGMRYQQVYDRFFRELGECVRIISPKVLGIQGLEDCIKKGIPIICTTSSAFLQYDGIYSKLNEFQHYITLLGIDEAGAVISDCCIPSYPVAVFQGRISNQWFQKIWNFESTLLYIIDKEKLKKFNIVEKRFEYLYKNIENYLDNETVYENGLQVPSGINAALELACDIDKYKDFFVQHISEVALNLKFQLDYYGLITSKKIILEQFAFLKVQLKIEDINYLEQLEVYKSIIKLWTSVSMQLLKIKFTKSYTELQRLARLMQENSRKEIEIITYFRNAITEKTG